MVVYALPDDGAKSKAEAFNREAPPCVEDFCVEVFKCRPIESMVAQYEGEANEWYPTGSAVLLRLTRQKYVFIGNVFAEFQTHRGDEIVEFRAPCSSGRALIRGQKFTYVICHNVMIPNQELNLDTFCQDGQPWDPKTCVEIEKKRLIL